VFFGIISKVKYIISAFLLLLVACFALPAVAFANPGLTAEITAPNADYIHASRVRPFTLVYEGRTWTAGIDDVRQWFTVRHGANNSLVIQLRPDRIYHYLNVHVSPRVNRVGQPSRFILRGGEFHLIGPGHKGIIVDGAATSLAIREAILTGKSSAQIHVKEHRPRVFSVDDFKRLRFPHHLGSGVSNFAGSPRNRVHNILVSMRRYNGIVIFPGEEFSFNRHLGAVTAANGYLPELVIRGNMTIPEFGGGICQVSTTAFRAAMRAGLQITSRRPHSYPVSYYGTPGFDATIYPGITDFRFRNDMQHPIYITTRIEGTHAIFDIWGTSDGRETQVIGPYVTHRRPDGSLTAAVAQIVRKDGRSIREQNFVSHYQPAWRFPVTRGFR
jgi:vancomycin resistance protein YoaR